MKRMSRQDDIEMLFFMMLQVHTNYIPERPVMEVSNP